MNNVGNIVVQIELNNFGAKDLKGLIEFMADEAADEINRCGLDGQVSFILHTLGEAGGVSAINKELGTDIRIGEFVIHSAKEEGYWCNGFGWVYLASAASGLIPEELLGTHAQLVAGPEAKGEEIWWTKCQDGSLAGSQGIDFDGPYETRLEAAADAIVTLGIRPSLVGTPDAAYVIAERSRVYDLDLAA